ncbi:MAG TPA: polysaccharide deacetylase family protein [Bryobacteraceae bacterium]|nr:polysaccharide deacetylase family protein [Bryobacteraceae bacterium]
MIRSWIKTKAAGALSRTGIDKAVGSFAGWTAGAVVLGYHRVVEDFQASAETSIPSMLISRQMLERHIDWLGRRFRFVSLDEVGARLDGSDSSADPVVALTFDDGYRDFYELALPVLKHKGVPAAVFVVTDLVGTTQVQLHDKLYLLLARLQGKYQQLLTSLGIRVPGTPYHATRALLEGISHQGLQRVTAALESESAIPDRVFEPFHSMTWEMVDSVHRAGMTVGSHTRTHVLMANESPQRMADEAGNSRRELERRLGTGVRHFAYPSGQFNGPAVTAVADAGYQFAYTVCNHRDAAYPRLTVPRTLLWENSCRDFRGSFSGSIMSCQVHRAFGMLGGCKQRHAAGEEMRSAQR